jgi:hypothetical protein
MKINYDHHEHEHEFEAQLGLPERLPKGERILWQGSPDAKVLARQVFHLRSLVVYFSAILALRGAFVLWDGGTLMAALKAVGLVAPLAALAIGMAWGMAIMCARTTVYTITTKRVVMRIGIVLNLSFNLPLVRLEGAGLRDTGLGTGDIPLTLAKEDHIAYLHLWPHARPWRSARPEPMLRCVPDAAHVSAVLAQAWREAMPQSAAAAAAKESTAAAALPSPAAMPVDVPKTPATRPSASNEGAGRRWTPALRAVRLTPGA